MIQKHPIMSKSKNVEIKAHCSDLEHIRKLLIAKQAYFKGMDHQIDTYFNVKNGRLKLREGNIENNLIQYNRPDQAGPKQSDFALFKTEKGSSLKNILEKSIGIKVIIDKQREIYFIDNVKFHLDEVKDLGTFVEIEATDVENTMTVEYLNDQCQQYISLFGIADEDLLTNSYSDLLKQK